MRALLSGPGPGGRILGAAVSAVLALGLAACQQGDAPATPMLSTTPGKVEPVRTDDDLLAQMPTTFVFESGAGGWSDQIEVNQDGSVTWHYVASKLYETGPDHPNGTLTETWVTGQLEVVRQVSDLEYEINLVALDQVGTPGEEIKDGVKVVTPELYDSDSVREQPFILYLPGTKTSDLPEAVGESNPLWLGFATEGSVVTRWCLFDTTQEVPYWSDGS